MGTNDTNDTNYTNNASGGFTTRRNIMVTDDIYKDMKLIAVKTSRNISDVIQEALAEYAARELPKVMGS